MKDRYVTATSTTDLLHADNEPDLARNQAAIGDARDAYSRARGFDTAATWALHTTMFTAGSGNSLGAGLLGGITYGLYARASALRNRAIRITGQVYSRSESEVSRRIEQAAELLR